MKSIKAPKARKLPSGAWNCQVMIQGKSKSFTGWDRGEVEQAALKYKLQGQPEHTTSETLKTAALRYIDERQAVLSPSTINRYRQYVKNDLGQLTRLRVDVITQSDCQKALNLFLKNHRPKTAINTWMFFHAVLKDNGKIIDITLPQDTAKEHPFLQPEQVTRFLQEIQGEQLEVPILLGLHGLRRSELMDLTWEDIDLDKGTIKIRGSAVRGPDGFVHKETNKAKASRRTVYIIIPRLTELLKQEKRVGKYVVHCNINSPYDAVNRVCERLGFPKVGMHGLRHSFASLLFHLGANQKAVKALGGWENDSTVQKIYTHLADQDLQDAVTKIKGFFE